MNQVFSAFLIGALTCATFCGCGKEEQKPETKTYPGRGIVKELEPDGKTVVISHEAFTNYMPAMTMPFEAKDTNELRGLSTGDSVTFNLVVGATHGWIENIVRLDTPKTNTNSPPPEQQQHLSFTHALPPLDEGDMLPDYKFTNELGEATHLSQFRGRVLAFTFFFTSCPFPDFCPRMTSNFSEAAKKLKAMTNAPAQWQLLSISFDPTNDTPKRLLNYATTIAHYNPANWSFLTGDPAQIGGLADQMEENFWREANSVGHNLRTVVVDAKGQIRNIIPGNKWTVDEFVQDVVKAGR
ncbi:MAG TPA: SCO family protein [Verrucomicrobiae bacterium]|jgi:protein SCO1/2